MRMEQAIKPRRSKLAQSRIDYIVFGNPGPVRNMIYDYGYEPPRSLPDLSGAVRELIRQEGKKAVIDLVKLHPDRDAILGAEKETTIAIGEGKSEDNKEPVKKEPDTKPQEQSYTGCAACAARGKSEDSYCGGCNHAYDESSSSASSIEDLSGLNAAELLARYEALSKQAAASPKNKQLATEATRIWNEIRQRNQNPPKKDEGAGTGFTLTPQQRVVLMIVTGILVGTLIAFTITHKMMKEIRENLQHG